MGTINLLLAATIGFVGGHFLLSSAAVRPQLARRLGESGFRTLYSVVAIVTFVVMIYAYGAAPYVPVWPELSWLRWVPLVVMPFSAVLVVAGLTTRSPTAVGGEALAADSAPAPGILRVTRHPFLWGVALWAGCHLLVNGDAASIILMGGMLVLAVGGMQHIDRRRERVLGSDWGPMKLTTSTLPFAALLSGRTRMDWRGLGWWRLVLGLLLYVVLLNAHPFLFGASPLP